MDVEATSRRLWEPCPTPLLVTLLLVAGVSLAAPRSIHAQVSPEQPDTVYSVDPVIVTTTRGPRAVSDTPQPVAVLQTRDIERQMPNTIADLLTTLPGMDVTGVGVNQGRPQIRGLRGQRILLLSDGLRLNNTRRQQDFGELPALVDVTGAQRVEVVRGPASVLYGSDAIGGVVNIISRDAQEEGVHGNAAIRYGSVGEVGTATARAYGRLGTLTFQAGGMFRQAQPYEAPEGSFGDITLDDEVLVNGTGVDDRGFDAKLGIDTGDHAVFGKFEHYGSDDAGFGNVDPALYDPTAPEIDLTYPNQRFNKITAGYRGEALDFVLADRFELLAYGQDNERDFNVHLPPFDVPFGPGVTGNIEALSQNTTDIRTYGFRAEARKVLAESTLLTYGADLWRDRAKGTDVAAETVITTVTLPPPPAGPGGTAVDTTVTVDFTPSLPEAAYTSFGVFAQAEIQATERLSFIGGARWQRATSEVFDTPGLGVIPNETTDGTVVGAVNAMLEVADGTSLIASVGRAFRSPNLIERYFEGEVREGAAGGAFQVANPDLEPETSLNIEVGIRHRSGPVGVELFAFRNKIYDGIRSDFQGDSVGMLPRFQSTNVDELLFRGIELGADYEVGAGVTVLGSYTWMDTENVDAGDPVGDAFSSRMTGSLRYDDAADRFWLAGEVRRNGEQKDANLSTDHLLGATLPSFTVVDVRGGVRLPGRENGLVHRVNVALTNLTNTLYAEFANASFFRPEPKRSVTVSYEIAF